MALPVGRAIFFVRRMGFEAGERSRDFGAPDVCFRGAGASERKICCGTPETLQSGASAGKLYTDALKGSKMGV